MRKTYILDTSVLVHDYSAIEKFVDNDIVIPIAVLEELDHLKTRPDNVGTNARKAIRILEELCSKGNIQNGIDIGQSITVYIDVTNVKSSKFDSGSKDDSILSCLLARSEAGENAVIVSKDINMRLRAKAYGIDAQDYENDKIKNVDELYSGNQIIELTDHLEGFSTANGMEDIRDTVFETLLPNEYVEVMCNGNSYLFRRHPNDKLLPVRQKKAWGITSRSKEQAFLLDALFDPEIPLVTVSGSAGTGKAQPLDSKVLTPSGWVYMGDLKVGNLVSTPDGKSAPITGIFPQGVKDIYKVQFSDGSFAECCEDHLWATKSSKDNDYVVRDLKTIQSSLDDKHYIPINKPIEFVDNKDSSAFISKYHSLEERLSFLHRYVGSCLDSDNVVHFFTDKSFCDDLKFIVQSLGKICTIETESNNLYKVTIVLKDTCRYITGIKFVGKKQAQCIMVDHPDHLYITNDFIVTHNTLISTAVGLESVIENHRYHALKMFKPVVTIPGQDVGFLPGDMSDKIKPFMGSFYDALEVLFKDEDVERKLFMFKDRITFEPLTYIRGRSLTNSFLVFDETQNLTKNDIKTIITRIGEGTKVVFCGDYHQIDVSYLDISNNGLTQLIESFKNYDLAAHVTLQKGERSKLSALAASIL